jgi:hypothetical protein
MNVIMNEDNHLFWPLRFADCLIVTNWQSVPVAEKYTLFNRESWVAFVQAFPQGGHFERLLIRSGS